MFDAIARRETYATTGPRITLRVFLGALEDVQPGAEGWVEAGYADGVPMGGMWNGTGAPVIVADARRDPDGAGLDRMQIIKGWIGEDGQTRERVFDVAASDGRAPGADWRVAPLRSTVDASDASYDRASGADRLSVNWTDPAFVPGEAAFYYVRVVQVPTPRWSTFDRVRFDVDLPEGTPVDVRDRAYSSPIWTRP